MDVTWLHSLSPKLLQAELGCKSSCGSAASSSSVSPFPFTPDEANTQPPQKGITKIQRVKDFPTGVPTSIINVRPKVTLLL